MNYEVRSISYGYGFKIKWDENWYTGEFNKQGIMEKTESVIDGSSFKSVLYSVNGEIYRTIPGYPTYILIVTSLMGVFGIFFFIRSRIKMKQ